MGRTNQGGSILSFVIIGVVLAGLLIGGVYLVNRQTTQPSAPTTKQPEKPANRDDGQNEKQSPPPATEPGNKPQPETDINTTTELPTTGPTEFVGSLIAVGLLSGVATSYLRSRRFSPLFDL